MFPSHATLAFSKALAKCFSMFSNCMMETNPYQSATESAPRKHGSAWTIILMVMIIMGVVLSVPVGTFIWYRIQSKNRMEKASANLKQLRLALEGYRERFPAAFEGDVPEVDRPEPSPE